MSKKRWITGVITASIASFALLASGCIGGGGASNNPTTKDSETPNRAAYKPPHSMPGPAVDRIEFSKHGVDQAPAHLGLGKDDIAIYLFGLKINAAQEIEGASDITSYHAPAGAVSLILNPAPAREGEINPFSMLEVRQATNYLIDRQFVADNIYGDYAEPQISHVSSLDYDYLTVASTIAEQGIRFDPDRAKRMITHAMTQDGASLVNGKWQYQGKPVVLKIITRTEDERREVGNAVATTLTQLGFEVRKIPQEFATAIQTVYSSDPEVFQWHIYTEGWGRGSADRYDFASLNGFNAPWMANMPGWGIFGFWQYENAQLDEIGKKIFTGEFTSKEARDDLYREATDLGLNEAVRVWVVTTMNTIPAVTNLTGVVEDVVAGPKNLFMLREAYIPGRKTLRVGNLWVHTERSVWNPVGGFEDVYSIDIWKNLTDPAIVNDPATGLPRSFRAGYEVESADPTTGQKLTLPGDVVVWDAAQDAWVPVPQGTQATSKVVFDYAKYMQSTWHHGQPITMADVLYNLASTFDRTYDTDKQQIEFVLAATQKPILDVFRGFRVLDANRLEVYLDYWHFDENYIASYASIAMPPMPWEILAASDELVFKKQSYAFSKAAAVRYFNGNKQLSLVLKDDAGFVANILEDYLRDQAIPEFVANAVSIGGQSKLTPVEVQERVRAALAWYEEYNHLVISNGPFVLTKYDPPAQYAEISACHEGRTIADAEGKNPCLFTIKNYPFKPGDWYQEKPELVTISAIDVLSTNEVLERVSVELEGPGTLALDYVVVDPSTGKVEASGHAVETSSGKFQIDLDSVLVNRYRDTLTGLDILLLASSDAVALVSEERQSIFG